MQMKKKCRFTVFSKNKQPFKQQFAFLGRQHKSVLVSGDYQENKPPFRKKK